MSLTYFLWQIDQHGYEIIFNRLCRMWQQSTGSVPEPFYDAFELLGELHIQ